MISFKGLCPSPGLIRSSTEDPPDVTYGRASFEIKEILDAGRLRHQEAKTGRYAAAPLIAAPLTPLDIATEVFDRLQEAHTHYAPEVKAQTDFLCYVNLRWRHFEQGPLPQPTLFDKFGWRSVSAVVQANESLVFYANAEAPEFLQKRAGLVCSRGYAPV